MSDILDRVRQRYPDYKDVPDNDLALAIGSKYPQYLEADSAFKSEYQQAATTVANKGLQATLETDKTLVRAISSPAVLEANQMAQDQSQGLERASQSDVAHVEDVAQRLQAQQDQPPKTDLTALDNPLASEFTPGIEPGMTKAQDEPVLQIGSIFSDEQRASMALKHPKILGTVDSVIENVNALTTPKSLTLLAAGMGIGGMGPVAARAVSLGFAALMAKSVPDIAARLGEEYAKPEAERDQVRIAKLISDGAIATGFTTLAAFHGAEPHGRTVARMISNEVNSYGQNHGIGGLDFEAIRGVAPLTAQALEELPATRPTAVDFGKSITSDKVAVPGDEPVAAPGLGEAMVAPAPAEAQGGEMPSQTNLGDRAGEAVEPKKTFQDVLADNARRKKERQEFVESNLKSAGDAGGVELRSVSDPNTRLIVTPDISEPGKWRVTRLDEKGPYGHNVFDTREAAIRAASGESFTDMVKGPHYYGAGEFVVKPKEVAAPTTDVSEKQMQSGQPEAADQTVAQEEKKGKRVGSGLTGRARFNKETEINGPDVMSWIQENMKLLSKTEARAKWGRGKFTENKSLYDDSGPLSSAHHNVIYDSKGSAPDKVAQAAYDAGVIDSPDVSTLWQAIKSSSDKRRNAFKTIAKEKALNEALAGEHESWLKATADGQQKVSADDLKVGDFMEVDGEHVEVTHIDPDSGDVTLKDGKKFGKQTLESGKSIHVEKLEQAETSTEFAPEEPAKAETPKLRAGEKGTGDLLQGADQPFNLAGEKATDFERIQQEKAKAEKSAAEAKAAQDKQQTGFKGMGGATPSEYEPGGGPASSNKNAVVDAERAQRGLLPMMSALRKTWGDAWTKAMAMIDHDPAYQDRLIAELKDKPRALEDYENAALLQRRVSLNNEYDKATRDGAMHYSYGYEIGVADAKQRIALWSDKLAELDSVTKAAGTESGRSLAARKMMMDEDFTLARLETSLRASKNFEPVTDAERAELTKIAEDYKAKAEAAEKALQAEKDRQAEAESKKTHADLITSAPETAKVKSLTQRIVDVLEKEANESRKYLSRKTFTISPDVLYHLSKIGALEISRGALELGAWSTKMVKEFGDKIKPHLAEVWKKSNELLDKYAEKTAGAKYVDQVKKAVRGTADTVESITEKIKAKAVDDKMDEIGPYVQKLARAFVGEGVKDRNTLIDKIHEILKDIDPEITRRETMDAISGYGKYKLLTKDQISVQLRDLKGQMQQVGKLEDMQAKQAPLKTGVERRAPSDEERRLIKLVNEAKKKGGFTVTDPARQLATSLGARKTYLRNRMSDLNAEIQARQKLIKQKQPTPTDPELTKLRAEYEKVKEEHAAMFPKQPITDAQRIAIANRSLDREISQLESDLSAGKLERAKGKPPIETPELLEKRAWLQALREHRQELRDILNPKKTPEERANQAFKTRTASRIAELEQKMANGDFSPKARAPFQLDPEAQTARANLETVKKRFEDMKIRAELANRTPWEKVMDWGTKYRRFGVLSSPVVIPKLISAGLQRLTSMPLEELVGEVARDIPGLSKVSDRAPMEGGGVHWGAERAGWKAAFTQGLTDAWKVLKSGHSDLDAIYGKPKETYSGESEMASNVLAFPGRLHGLIKAPIKRAAFERAVVRLGDFYHSQGLDLADPLVKTRIGVEAYKAANRSIFLQDNILATKVASFLSEVKDKNTGHATVGSKILSTAGRIALPIVRVPTNIVAETFQYIGGTGTGGIRLARALARGAENIKPEEADLIMRELKKGSIGAAVLLLGYFNANVIGGYYQPKSKQEQKFGTVKIYGHEIPSYLLHNPLLETLQFGATIRHVADSHLRKRDKDSQGDAAGIMAATIGLVEETPFVREMAELEKLRDPFQRDKFLGEQAKSMAVPSVLQKAAEWTDRAEKRNPTNLLQHIESGVPGLRQRVPEAKKK